MIRPLDLGGLNHRRQLGSTCPAKERFGRGAPESGRVMLTLSFVVRDPERTFAHPLTGLCLPYGRPSACQRDKTTSNQLDLLCKRAVPGRFGVVSTNEGYSWPALRKFRRSAVCAISSRSTRSTPPVANYVADRM